MKLMIASDIHGSLHYCNLLLNAFNNEKPDKLILLGDLLYHGPRNDLPKDYAPKKVAELLNAYSDVIISVRGNCEAEVDSLMLSFPVTPDYGVIFDGKQAIYLSHGHREKPKMPADSLYITGHTHVPHDIIEDGVRLLNPGSVSIPKNNTPHSVIIYDDGQITWFDIEKAETYTI